MQSQPFINLREEFLSFGQYQFENKQKGFHQHPFSLTVTQAKNYQISANLTKVSNAFKFQQEIRLWLKPKVLQRWWVVTSFSLNKFKIHIDLGNLWNINKFKSNFGLGLKSDRLFGDWEARASANFQRKSSADTSFEGNLRLNYRNSTNDFTLFHRHLCIYKQIHYGLTGNFNLKNINRHQTNLMLAYRAPQYEVFLRTKSDQQNSGWKNIIGDIFIDIFYRRKGHLWGLNSQTSLQNPKMSIFGLYFKNQIKGKNISYKWLLNSQLNAALSLSKRWNDRTQLTVSAKGNIKEKTFSLGVNLQEQI